MVDSNSVTTLHLRYFRMENCSTSSTADRVAPQASRSQLPSSSSCRWLLGSLTCTTRVLSTVISSWRTCLSLMISRSRLQTLVSPKLWKAREMVKSRPILERQVTWLPRLLREDYIPVRPSTCSLSVSSSSRWWQWVVHSLALIASPADKRWLQLTNFITCSAPTSKLTGVDMHNLDYPKNSRAWLMPCWTHLLSRDQDTPIWSSILGWSMQTMSALLSNANKIWLREKEWEKRTINQLTCSRTILLGNL